MTKQCKKCGQSYDNNQLNKSKEAKKVREKANNHRDWCYNCIKTAIANNFQGEWAGNNLQPNSLPKKEYDLRFYNLQTRLFFLQLLIERNQWYSDWEQRKPPSLPRWNRLEKEWKEEKDIKKIEDRISLMLGLNELSTAGANAPWLITRLKEDYYKWIDACGITNINAPERLKHWLFSLHQMLECKNEKYWEEFDNQEEKELTPEEEKKIMEEGYRKINELINKKPEFHGRFTFGNAEKGKKTFEEIVANLTNYQNFHYFPQRKGEKKNKESIDFLQFWKDKAISEIKEALQKTKINSKALLCEDCVNWEEKLTNASTLQEVEDIKKATLDNIQKIQNLRQEIYDLETKPNRTPEEEQELTEKKKQLILLEIIASERNNQNQTFNWKPWIIGSIIFFLVAITIIYLWTKFQKTKTKKISK